MTSLRYLIPGFERNTMLSGVVPGLFDYLDFPDVGSLTMPGYLMVVQGWRDDLFPADGVRAALETLRQCVSVR